MDNSAGAREVTTGAKGNPEECGIADVKKLIRLSDNSYRIPLPIHWSAEIIDWLRVTPPDATTVVLEKQDRNRPWLYSTIVLARNRLGSTDLLNGWRFAKVESQVWQEGAESKVNAKSPNRV